MQQSERLLLSAGRSRTSKSCKGKARILDQDTKDELREVLASLEEDLQAAYIPGNRPENETHEDRLRALEAALKVALHALIDSK